MEHARRELPLHLLLASWLNVARGLENRLWLGRVFVFRVTLLFFIFLTVGALRIHSFETTSMTATLAATL